MTNPKGNQSSQKGINLNPKTNEEALALLRWIYGSKIPAYSGTDKETKK